MHRGRACQSSPGVGSSSAWACGRPWHGVRPRAQVRGARREVLGGTLRVAAAAGPSVFDLPLSTPPPAPRHPPGPPPQKTKTNVGYVGYVGYARRWRNFCGLEAQDEDFLWKIEVKDGLCTHRTPGWIELWSPNAGQDGLCDRHVPWFGVGYVRCVRYVRYTPLALGMSTFWGRAPSVFCFLFSPPAHYP